MSGCNQGFEPDKTMAAQLAQLGTPACSRHAQTCSSLSCAWQELLTCAGMQQTCTDIQLFKLRVAGFGNICMLACSRCTYAQCNWASCTAMQHAHGCGQRDRASADAACAWLRKARLSNMPRHAVVAGMVHPPTHHHGHGRSTTVTAQHIEARGSPRCVYDPTATTHHAF